MEPVFGIIKNVLGFRQFSMRGLKKAHSEWQLVCIKSDRLLVRLFECHDWISENVTKLSSQVEREMG